MKKNRIKKIISVLLVASSFCFLMSCGNNNNIDENTNTEKTEEKEETNTEEDVVANKNIPAGNEKDENGNYVEGVPDSIKAVDFLTSNLYYLFNVTNTEDASEMALIKERAKSTMSDELYKGLFEVENGVWTKYKSIVAEVPKILGVSTNGLIMSDGTTIDCIAIKYSIKLKLDGTDDIIQNDKNSDYATALISTKDGNLKFERIMCPNDNTTWN